MRRLDQAIERLTGNAKDYLIRAFFSWFKEIFYPVQELFAVARRVILQESF